MAEKRPEELTSSDLRHYQTIRATCTSGFVEIWDSKRLVPFVSADTEGALIEDLDVLVPALDARSVAALQDRIAGLEKPEWGRRRLLEVDPSRLDGQG